ncbi:right-handed parallel beta-helix repeat-containing protein [bacterium]|nr:right-handed parallel beta-helix repeat-containing protein [bacterium]
MLALVGSGRALTARADTATVVGCSAIDLRDAINAANVAGSGTLALAAGCTYTFTTASGPVPVITGHVTILGDGSTVDGGGASMNSSVFSVNSFGHLDAYGLAIVGGNRDSDGAGLNNGGTVVLTDCIVHGNTADGRGGGIANFGTLTLIRSTVSGNTSPTSLGSVGGGIYNFSTATLTAVDSTIRDNSAFLGGNVFNDGGAITLNSSTVSGSLATNGSQGIFTRGGGMVTLSHSAIVNNFGGGIDNDGSTIVIDNSTIAGNADVGGSGISNAAGTVTITSSTISGNLAYWSYPRGAGIFNSLGGTVEIKSSVIAGNMNLAHADAHMVDNCDGGITDSGYNVSDDPSCLGGPPAPTFDVATTSAAIGLGSLAANGSTTQTMAITSSSAAYGIIPATDCPITDQRGYTRLTDGDPSSCDAGAFEAGAGLDTDLALINVPPDTTVYATGVSGAIVTYTAPSAVDDDSPSSAVVNCSSASGSTFAIGTTAVVCTGFDADDTNSPVTATFSVTVEGGDVQLTALSAAVQGVGPGSSLADKVQAARTYFDKSDLSRACGTLNALVHEINAQTDKTISLTTANILIDAARQIEAVIGC